MLCPTASCNLALVSLKILPKQCWKDELIAKQLRALAALLRELGFDSQQPYGTLQLSLTPLGGGGSDALLWFLLAVHTHGVHTHKPAKHS